MPLCTICAAWESGDSVVINSYPNEVDEVLSILIKKGYQVKLVSTYLIEINFPDIINFAPIGKDLIPVK